jgi:D-lactate dehydrogenase
VGAVRDIGTTVIIEDVAFPIEHLAHATLDLQKLFTQYHYDEAIIFGHAFEGNLHFVFTQDFSNPAEVSRYKNFMDDVVDMVVTTYDGSLKAEHGTGRNMAPFVEKEWGSIAYELMKEIKDIFDPGYLLNPGVILNDDPNAHIHHLKSLPATHLLADKCIECGFCEPVCPSRDLTFSPRQRIAGRREISRKLLTKGGRQDLKHLVQLYQYPGIDTCAADGLCQTRCPVGIDTGKMIKALRSEAHGELSKKVAQKMAQHFDRVTRGADTALNVVNFMHRILGTRAMKTTSDVARRVSQKRLPEWNRQIPNGIGKIHPGPVNHSNYLKVVYFPSCASRVLGGSTSGGQEQKSLPEVTLSLLKKAGYEVIYPNDLDLLCCGQAFESKGFMKEADEKSAQLSKALMVASDNGSLPVLCDTSPCLHRMKENLDNGLHLYEPIEFVLCFLKDLLKFKKKDGSIAIHPTCSTRKMGLEQMFLELARLCVDKVIWPEEIYCCGFAGDKGFTHPELNKSALHGLADHVCTCQAGYSTSKTCEIGLSQNSGIPYQSILYLVDEVTTAISV